MVFQLPYFILRLFQPLVQLYEVFLLHLQRPIHIILDDFVHIFIVFFHTIHLQLELVSLLLHNNVKLGHFSQFFPKVVFFLLAFFQLLPHSLQLVIKLLSLHYIFQILFQNTYLNYYFNSIILK